MVRKRMEDMIYQGSGQKGDGERGDIIPARLNQSLHLCGLGSMQDRAYVKEYIKEILTEQFQMSEEEMDFLIPFSMPQCQTDVERFEILLYQYRQRFHTDCFEHFYEDCVQLGTEDVQEKISGKTLLKLCMKRPFRGGYLEKLDIVTQRIYEVLYGYSVCDLLISDDVDIDGVSAGCGGMPFGGKMNEKETYSYQTIYVMLHGKKIRLEFLKFESEQELECVAKKMSRNQPQMQLSRKNSCLVTGLRNNTRVVITRPPVAENWTFYVRKFGNAEYKQTEELLTDENAEYAVSILKMLVCGCQNFVITGEQASGKTTLLKSLVRYIDPRYSIRVAENVFETRLSSLYPERNIQTLQEYGNTRMEDILALLKKTDCDVTICGELNSPDAAEAFVQVAQAGGRFTICTSHHTTTEKLISYMRNALMKGIGFPDARAATSQVVETVRFDVHLALQADGHRYLERITEIVPDDQYGYHLVNILIYKNGYYEICGKMSDETAHSIKRHYAGWKEECVAYVLGEQTEKRNTFAVQRKI